MAQADQTIQNATFPTVRADINNNLAALFSANSGSTAPSVTVAFQDWIDTSGANAVWKKRNAANNAWITLGTIVGSTIAFQGTLPDQAGNAGEYLTTDGTVASWAAITATGQLLRAPQVLTSGTTYTTPAGCTAIYVEAVGGGGGGSGGATGGSPTTGAGGGAGGYCAKYFTVTASTTYSYTIGAGGTGGGASVAPGAGGGGGNTTFTVGATTITAGGAPATVAHAGGGISTNGDINVRGGGGSQGGSGVTTPSRKGGNSFFGGGGGGTGVAGEVGGGGSGGAASAGGAGGNGLIRIWEYS